MKLLTKAKTVVISIHGIGVVRLRISPEGVQAAVPGSRKALSGSWEEIVTRLHAPEDAPSIYFHDPRGFLLHQAKKREVTMAKRSAGNAQ
jgi:hypothetical protein